MPRISEATLEEHRRKTMNALLDSAETILKTRGDEAFTAVAVGQGAGIARNSIYRYVRDMGELRHRVLERHLPAWQSALDEGLAGIEDPHAIIAVWVRINLEQAAIHGHAWLMRLPAGMAGHPGGAGAANRPKPDFHSTLEQPVLHAWAQLRHDCPQVGVAVTLGLVTSGMGLLESEKLSMPARRSIIADMEKAARALTETLSDTAA